MNDVQQWLLEGPPWVQYRTRIDLLGQGQDEAEVLAVRKAMLEHPLVQDLMKDLSDWPGDVLKRHNDAKHNLHKLTFVVELGIGPEDAGMAEVAEKILSHQSPEGPFQTMGNIPTHFGGTGQDTLHWMLCDAPLITEALIRLGYGNDPRVELSIEYMKGLVHENGWPCAATASLGKFKGPGRREDPCPYANLLMLQMLSALPEEQDGEAAHLGVETMFGLWELRREKKPFLFAMGTDFHKLKAPLIWYDILHVLDVLTRFPWLRDDSRLSEMLSLLRQKADDRGRYTAESVWLAWKEWDFGQKKEPSPWIAFLVKRLLKRVGLE